MVLLSAGSSWPCCSDTPDAAVIFNVERSSLTGLAGSRRTPSRNHHGDHPRLAAKVDASSLGGASSPRFPPRGDGSGASVKGTR